VDWANVTYPTPFGDVYLAAHWTGPGFDPAESAFHGVRVFEIPTPCWTAQDATFYGIERPDNVPVTIQDRGYISPIWHTP
jgi:hypothetical protein